MAVAVLLLIVVALYCPAFNALRVAGGKVLIVQNKGGGHGAIGYYLCKELLAKDPSVEIAILQDKCNYEKAPFSSYSELQSLGVKILDANLCDEKVEFLDPEFAKSMADFKPDYIVDNWSKSTTNSSFVIDIAKKHSSKHIVFVSSAGMYETSDTIPLVEESKVKENAPRKVELSYMESGFPYTFMRPQYIYGEKSSKNYLDYFTGRAVRKLHIPLPLSGEQLVCLTHVEDVASLVAASIGHSAAQNEVFNCGSDRFVTYKGLADMVHREVGSSQSEQMYMYFDPKLYGTVQFPFRRETFITSPGKAKRLLQWAPKHRIEQDVKLEVMNYKLSKDCARDWKLDDVRADLEILASKDLNFKFAYPFFTDPGLNEGLADRWDFETVEQSV